MRTATFSRATCFPRHLRLGNVRGRGKPAKHRRQFPISRVELGGKVVRQHARDIVDQPAARDMGKGLDPACLERLTTRFNVKPRRHEQRRGEAARRIERRGRGIIEFRELDYPAHQREAVRM
jgi:hypothetical protein